MRTFVQLLDENTARVTSLSLSCRRGVLTRRKVEKINVKNESEAQRDAENVNDGFYDTYNVYTTPIHEDNYQFGIPIYYRFLLYQLKLKIYSDFSETAKLIIYTDYTVMHVFDLSTMHTEGEYTMVFHQESETHTPEDVVSGTLDTDNRVADITGASEVLFAGDLFSFYKIDDVYRPKFVNVNPIVNDAGVVIPDAVYIKIAGNTEASAFASIEATVYPLLG